ncbi:ZIP family metal transporter [Patescibacteria group bacterium]|nr:ZIP family metal transporter [Patescibacteria group bacterium]
MILALIAALSIALLSLVGIFFFRESALAKANKVILPIAVGTFLSVVFFELIPEALHEAGTLGSIAIAGGFLFFYLLSHLLRTYHHHHGEHCHDENTKSAASLILVGDAIHNFADGIVIGTAFLINPTVGIVTAIGIALHEIPQEIAEFGVLRRAGYSPKKAAAYNFISASTVVVGTLAAFLIGTHAEGVIGILIGIAAGNLLYIAASDILPEIHNEHAGSTTFWKSFIATLFGMIAMTSLLMWSHEQFGHEEEIHTEGLATH